MPEATASSRQAILLTITKKLFFLTAVSLMIVGAFVFILSFLPGQRTFLTWIIFSAGLLGGFVSIQQRLPRAGLEELRELSASWTSMILIPLNGAIFALVLHLVFISGLLKGTLFPEYIQVKIDTYLDFKRFLVEVIPSSGPDLGKLLFWSFVAGFSERLVPQIIRKTTGDAVQPSEKKTE